MHESVMEFVTGVVDRHGLADLSVLEVGSLDVNGSVRGLFTGDYTGMDRKNGKGVDVWADDLSRFPSDHYGVVISTSALEHDPHFWVTLADVGRILRPRGYFILTTVSWGFFEHDNPDYYRFMPDVYPLLMELAGCDVVEWREDPQSGGPQMLGRRHG